MSSVAQLAVDRQNRLIAIEHQSRVRALTAWQGMDYQNLDQSWSRVGSTITQQVTAAQLVLATGSDRYTSQVATQTADFTATPSAIAPQAFAGVDGQGRAVDGILYGAVTATKEAVGAGLGRTQAFHAGATYLAAVLSTAIADAARNADLVSSAGKGFTHYVRVCNGAACSRCAILSGISSGPDAFARHLGCECTAVAVNSKSDTPRGVHDSVQSYFDSLTKDEQDNVFTKDGAQAIRDGADPAKVVNARRAAKGVGYSSHGGARTVADPRGHMVKTTIGYRPDGTPVEVYTTTSGTTGHGVFGRQSGNTGRVRLMPESINKIAGDDLKLRQAFLRDAGYIEYRQPVFNAKTYYQDIEAQRRADRILVNRATARFGNFYLG